MAATRTLLWTVVVTSCAVTMRGDDDAASLGDWANSAGHLLSRSCMYGFGVSGFYSQYDLAKRDRLWRVHCSRLGMHGGDFCWWTYEFVNELKQNFKFNCDDNSYISGVYSDYDAVTSDRVWRVECCRSPGLRLPNCVETDWVNTPGSHLEFYLPTNKALRGIYSRYDQETEDRIWRYHICDMERDPIAD